MIERAVEANPNCARSLHFRGIVRGWHGESDTAVADLERAMRLSPREPFNYGAMLGLALERFPLFVNRGGFPSAHE
jgi:cytochrome c-type biogenesis protein CcmH/NrfG